MELSATLVKQFVKATNDSFTPAKEKQAGKIYGTAVVDDLQAYVRLDGSDTLTPVSKVTDVQNGDRVLVSIENHKAVVTGNVTCPPSARTALDIEPDLEDLKGNVLRADSAVIGELWATKAYIDTLVAREITADTIIANAARIDTISGDLASYKKVVAEELTVANGWMLEGAIGDAQISSLSGNKLRFGTIDTSLLTIAAPDGKLQITGNTMQVSDDDRVRVQIGKDASGEYTLAVWDKDGKLIWDALGATEDTIQRPIIRDNMVAEDAGIQGYKLDINSVVRAVNEGTETISSTIVRAGDKTLEVLLEEQNNTITEYGETLSTQNARIDANQESIALKVDSQTYMSDLEQMTGNFNKITSEISLLKDQISLKVSKTDISGAIDEALGDSIDEKVNGTVEELVSGKLSDYATIEQVEATIDLQADSIMSAVSGVYATKDDVSAMDEEVSSLARWKTEASQKITKDGIISTVGSYYAKDGDLTNLKTRVTNAESRITQTEYSISSKVSKGDLISEINQSAGSVRISADKISLLNVSQSYNTRYIFGLKTDANGTVIENQDTVAGTATYISLSAGYGFHIYGTKESTIWSSNRLNVHSYDLIDITGQSVSICSNNDDLTLTGAVTLTSGSLSLKGFGNAAFDEVQLRRAGSNSNVLSLVTYKNGTTVQFNNLINDRGWFCPSIMNSDQLYRMGIGTTSSSKNLVAYMSSGSGSLGVCACWGGTAFSSRNITAPSSDIRLKCDIAPTEANALDVINQIQMRQFTWKDTGRHQELGFIADELELIDSSFAVGGGFDEDGYMNVKSVNTFYILGYVTKGIQELCQITDGLGTRMNADEAWLTEHQKLLDAAFAEIAKLKTQLKQASA